MAVIINLIMLKCLIPGTDKVFISSGADIANAWGFALIVGDTSITARLKLLVSTTIYTAEAEDVTYVYDDSQVSLRWCI